MPYSLFVVAKDVGIVFKVANGLLKGLDALLLAFVFLDSRLEHVGQFAEVLEFVEVLFQGI